MKRALAWLIPLGALAVFLSFPFPPPLLHFLCAELCIALLIVGGLWFGQRYGLGSSIPSWKRIAYSLLIGAAAGAAILPLLPLAGLHSRLVAEANIPLWKWLVISFDSAILEEVVFRLFLVSFVVWLLGRFLKRETATWIALVVAALAFGIAHLPRWIEAGPFVITAVMIVNGIVAVVLGRLYVKWGIEAAMIGHFAGDLVVHVAGPHLFV